MSRESLVFLLGVVVFLLPIIGVPPLWKEYALSVVGAFLIVIGFSLRRSAYQRKIDRGNGEKRTDSFVESLPVITDYTPEDAEMEK